MNLNIILLLVDNVTGKIVTGSKQQLDILSDTEDVLQGVSMRIQPNPAQDVTYVNLTVANQSDVLLTLRNSLGQLVSQRTYDNLTGSNLLPVFRKELNKGTYFVTLTIDGKNMTQIVVF